MHFPAAVLMLIPWALSAQRGAPPGEYQGRRPTPAAAEPLATQPEDYGSVEGSVLNALTGEPLRKATVTLRRAESRPSAPGGPRFYTATTDSAGRFHIPNVAPGKYRLAAARNGFVETDYGARDPQSAGDLISVEPRRRVMDLAVRLMPHGVITGRIVDEDGEPVAGVQVQAWRYRYSQGRKQLAAYGSASSNDIGEYRIYGLPPGKYFVSATHPRSSGIDRWAPYAPSGANDSGQQYVTVFYPSAVEVSTAAPVEVGAGGEVRGLDIALMKVRTITVRGRVTDATGSDRRRLTVFLAPKDGGAWTSVRRASGVSANGEFEIRGVTPGSYFLIASIADRERALSARLPLQAGSSNIDNVTLTINPPMELSGRVRIDGSSPAAASLSSIQVNLIRKYAVPMSFGADLSARAKTDGSFTISNVSPDVYVLTVSNLPESCYVKAIRVNDIDVLTAGLDTLQGAPGLIDVVLAPNAGVASGVVQDDADQPVAGAAVVLVPGEKDRREFAHYYRTATTDSSGRFTFKNLEPGRYTAYAWSTVDPGAYLDPDFLQPLADRGVAVSIREGSQEELKLRLIR